MDGYISLELEGEYPFDKPALKAFLVECTSVTALYLKMGDSSEEAILRALAYDGALPKLTSLRVAVQSIWSCPGAVLDLVELRCKGVNVAPLPELRIVEVENTQKEGKTVTGDILERWRVVRDKVEVLTVLENDF